MQSLTGVSNYKTSSISQPYIVPQHESCIRLSDFITYVNINWKHSFSYMCFADFVKCQNV